MNYEEKYNQALERAKKVHNGELTISPDEVNNFNVYEYIFPELRESKDERIRKGLVKGLSAMRDIHHHQTFSDDAINIDDAIAWLEKQGEQPAWSEEDEDALDIAIRIIQNGGDDCSGILDSNKALNWLNSIKPNHWKPSEEQMKRM